VAGCRAWSRIGNGSRHDRHNPGQASRPRRRTVRAEEYAPTSSPEGKDAPAEIATGFQSRLQYASRNVPRSVRESGSWWAVPLVC
jgi:hypothetical protein